MYIQFILYYIRSNNLLGEVLKDAIITMATCLHELLIIIWQRKGYVEEAKIREVERRGAVDKTGIL